MIQYLRNLIRRYREKRERKALAEIKARVAEVKCIHGYPMGELCPQCIMMLSNLVSRRPPTNPRRG